MPPVMFSVVTKYHKGRHSLFLYNLPNTNNNLAFTLFCLITIVYGVFILALTTRRLHDTNNSGWWIVGTLMPFHIGDIIGVYVLILTLLPSRKNKWRQP